MKRVLNFFTLAAVACVLGFAGTASAQTQPITWSASQPLFQGVGNETGAVAQSVVDNSNTFVLGVNCTTNAVAAAGATTTVNGVVFTDVGDADVEAGFTQGGVTLTSSGNRATQVAFGTGNITDPELSNILQGGLFDQATWTFTGLTPNENYSVQIFVHDSRNGRTTDWQIGFSDGVNPVDPAAPAAAAILSQRDVTTGTGDPSGSSITGTFTAGADGTQSFEFIGTRNGFSSIAPSTSQVNALQLSLVSDMDLKGDVDMNGVVDFADIAPFIAVLQSGIFQAEADTDCNTVVDFGDIPPFIAILQGQ